MSDLIGEFEMIDANDNVLRVRDYKESSDLIIKDKRTGQTNVYTLEPGDVKALIGWWKR